MFDFPEAIYFHVYILTPDSAVGIFSHPDPFVRFSLYITTTQGVRYIAQAPASASGRLVDHFPIDAVKSRLLAQLILFIGNREYREPIGDESS